MTTAADTATIERFEIELGTFTYRARAAGPTDGRPIVFLHGVPQTSACWNAQLRAVAAAGHRGVAFDQRGFCPGARPADVEDYEMTHLVADVLAVADTLGFERFDVVGHDYGGGIAWSVAAHHPDRVRTVAVASTPHPAAFAESYRSSTSSQSQRSAYMRVIKAMPRDQAPPQSRAARFEAAFEGLPEDAVAEYKALAADPGAGRAILDYYRAASNKVAAATPKIVVPALYVWSDDRALGPEAAALTANHVTGPYRFIELEGVGHWIPEKAADVFNDALLAHLRDHREGWPA